MSAAAEPFQPSAAVWALIARARPKLFAYLELQKVQSFVHTFSEETGQHTLRVLNSAVWDVPEDVRAECDRQPDHDDITMVFDEDDVL